MLTPGGTPAVLVQRADLARWHVGRATARPLAGEGARLLVRVDALAVAPPGTAGRRLVGEWADLATECEDRRIDGMRTYDLRLYAAPREHPGGEGLGLVRSLRARPSAASAPGVRRGDDVVWTVYSSGGSALLTLEGVDDPAAWERLEGVRAAA